MSPAPSPSRLARSRYERLLPRLRDQLLDAQFALRESQSAALAIIMTGVPAAGRSESVARLLEWLDPKLVDVRAYDARAQDSRTRPRLWKYWQDLPARGRITVFFGAWYEEWVHEACRKRRFPPTGRQIAVRTRLLEAMLTRDGVQVLKIHLHVPPDVQRRRLRKLKENPLTRWRVTPEDRWLADHARRVDAAYARCIKATDHGASHWHLVDGSDPEYRFLEVGRRVLRALQGAAGISAISYPPQPMQKPVRVPILPVLRESVPLSEEEYEHTLLELQGRLFNLSRKKKFLKRGAVFAFEGMDAAGKGGAIARLVRALDVRQYRIIPVSAPTSEERLYPYLWRFWRRLPERGSFAIFDRSWYGRVLVERVRGFAGVDDWSRAFDEINEFERQLVEHGIVICKFWLDVSRKVQLERFKDRDANALKRFKVDPEDWVNRRHFASYQLAAAEMVKRTSTRQAPWTLIDGDDKYRARLAVLRAACEALESR